MSPDKESAFAIIRHGCQQFRVAIGDKLTVHQLPAEPGELINFDQVLLIASGQSTIVGEPLVSGAKVTAKVLGQSKGKKLIVYKKKRRKGYSKKQGHRQGHTSIVIEDIQATI